MYTRVQNPSPAEPPADCSDVLVTVIIPVYNEEDTISQLLDEVVATGCRTQIVVVDDGSTDNSSARIDEWRLRSRRPIELLRHPMNRGKGAAIRTGLTLARGAIVLIQDADLECDPVDYPVLLEPIYSGHAHAVYGSRYIRPENRVPWTIYRIGLQVLNLLVFLLFHKKLTDEAAGFKVFRMDMLRRLNLQCERFEFCPEVTAKLCRIGASIQEVPVRYRWRPRTGGKRIGWRDGLQAITTLIWWRFARFTPRDGPLAPAGPCGCTRVAVPATVQRARSVYRC